MSGRWATGWATGWAMAGYGPGMPVNEWTRTRVTAPTEAVAHGPWQGAAQEKLSPAPAARENRKGVARWPCGPWW
jgi:hypothetical protein